jgi:hypothetical protein
MCLGSTRHTLFGKMGRQGKEKLAVLWYCLQIKTCCWCNSFGQPWFLGMKFCQKATLIFKNRQNHPFFLSKTSRQKFHPFKSLFLGGDRHHRSVYWLLLSPLSPQFGKKNVPLKHIHQWPSVSFTGEFSPNFDLKKKWFRPIQKDFSWKNKWPKFARFWTIIFSNHQIFMISSSRKPRI